MACRLYFGDVNGVNFTAYLSVVGMVPGQEGNRAIAGANVEQPAIVP